MIVATDRCELLCEASDYDNACVNATLICQVYAQCGVCVCLLCAENYRTLYMG